MKFSIERDQILRPLQLVNGVVERRQTLPILGNILLTIIDDKLQLTGTDLEVELSGIANLKQLTTPGSVTVSARKLLDICRLLPEDSILEFAHDAHRLTLAVGKSRYSLATLPATEFPKVNDSTDVTQLTLDAAQLKQLIERTQFAMAQQDVRYYLNGTFWHLEGKTMTTVATDGHRLSLCKTALTQAQDVATKIIVPRKAIMELMRVLASSNEAITIVVSTNHIRFISADIVLVSKLIEGRFPDYQAIIPKNCQQHLRIDRDLLKAILTRVSILSNEKYRGVRLAMQTDHLRISASNSEHEEATEEVAANFEGEQNEIGMNVNYLLDVLNTLPKGIVILSFLGADKSVLIEHEADALEALNIIMPLRL
ncbi:MAG: DNA polymerase III subunit beta [Gammaproteobacteria bacterium]|nr:DNA polymerase III subunit beta [Gammaproteobacteria bacterium]